MSLLNLIVWYDRAYLVTDSGHYRTEDGVVTNLRPKSMVLPEHHIVVGTTGRLQCGHLAAGIDALEHLSQGQLVGELPNVARAAIETYNLDPESRSFVTFAAFAHDLGRAWGGSFATRAEPGVVPYRIIFQKSMLMPQLPGFNYAALSSPSAFNPHTDFLPIIEQQRHCNFGTPEQPICGIAGDIDIVVVSREGMFVDTLHTYPAQVGEKVILEPAVIDPLDDLDEIPPVIRSEIEAILHRRGVPVADATVMRCWNREIFPGLVNDLKEMLTASPAVLQ